MVASILVLVGTPTWLCRGFGEPVRVAVCVWLLSRTVLLRRAIGVYHYGPLRRSDWLPSGDFVEGQQVKPQHDSSESDWTEESDGSEFAEQVAVLV
jgi:hypothetical protein